MLVDAKLMINGKELKTQIEIDEVDLKFIEEKNEEKKKINGYERCETSNKYSYVNSKGEVISEADINLEEDDLRFAVANYYASGGVARNNARADQLMRQLRRFAVENRKEEIDWNDERKYKYNLYYNYVSQEIYIGYETDCRDFEIYFDSQETAGRAIEEFKDEITWYFTEYKDSL